MSPGDVAARLGVSGSTFRRISQDYEEVFEALPRDAQNRRLWTLEAAQRVATAHETVREGQADSTRAALEAIRDGRALPTRTEVAPTPDAGRALERLDELSAQLQQQGEGLAQLLQVLDARDAEIAGALRELAGAQRAQAEALSALRQEVRAATARPAPSPPSAPPRSLVKRVLRAVFNQS